MSFCFQLVLLVTFLHAKNILTIHIRRQIVRLNLKMILRWLSLIHSKNGFHFTTYVESSNNYSTQNWGLTWVYQIKIMNQTSKDFKRPNLTSAGPKQLEVQSQLQSQTSKKSNLDKKLPFLVDLNLPIFKKWWLSIAMLNYQRVHGNETAEFLRHLGVPHSAWHSLRPLEAEQVIVLQLSHQLMLKHYYKH